LAATEKGNVKCFEGDLHGVEAERVTAGWSREPEGAMRLFVMGGQVARSLQEAAGADDGIVFSCTERPKADVAMAHLPLPTVVDPTRILSIFFTVIQ
jgi:hypothetical protein